MIAVIRADASPDIGGGHIMRCLALAEVLIRQGWSVALACSPETVPTISALNISDLDLFVLDNPKNEAADLRNRWPSGIDWLIVDHYHRDSKFEESCRPWAKNILVIDDLVNRPHDCDLLINPNLSVTENDYKNLAPLRCRYLFGPNYALLRSEFSKIRPTTIAKRTHDLKQILVSFGLTDPINASAKIVQSISVSGLDLSVLVLATDTSPFKDQIVATTSKLADGTVIFNSTDMANHLVHCDLVIGAAGSSSWERCCLGVPSILVHIADNQIQVARALSEAGAVLYLGAADSLSDSYFAAQLQELKQQPEILESLSKAAYRICDGRGSYRVAMELAPEFDANGKAITLRPASLDDGKLMLEWQNSPGTRQFSRNPQLIETKNHFSWLDKKLDDYRCLFNMVLRNGVPVGVLRLELLDQEIEKNIPVYEISIVTAPEFTGQGVGQAALSLGRRLIPEGMLLGEVMKDNLPSNALFKRAGFSLTDLGYLAAPLETRQAST